MEYDGNRNDLDYNPQQIQAIAKYFCEKKIPAHIVLVSGRFYNGLIEEVTDELFMIDDYKLHSLPVFFAQVHRIEKYARLAK